MKAVAGDKIGRWVLIRRIETQGKNYVTWEAECSGCGARGVVYSTNFPLMRKKNASCRKCKAKDATTHGMSRTSTYRVWAMMIQRCYNKNTPMYRYYGGKGIGVHPEWVKDFVVFLEDMGERPDGLQLSRKDPDGDYTPQNSIWLPRGENQKNRRKLAPQIERIAKRQQMKKDGVIPNE